MALSDVLAGLFGRRRVVVYDVRAAAATVRGMTPNDLYRSQPALRAVVSFLADNVASVPIKCYVREGDADRPRDTESDLALLLSRPSGGMTTHELMRALVSDYCLYEQALWYRYPDPEAPSGWAIRHVPWSWTQAKETWNGFEPSAYTVTNPYTGGRVDLPAEDCIRFFGYDPDGSMEASSAIESLREVLSEQISAWEFRNGVWKNGGRVTQYLTRPLDAPDWGQGQDSPRARFIRSWRQKYSGKDGDDTGGTPLLEDGMELHTTTFNAREAEWAEATRLTREDVAAVYHVNPSQIWHTESQTYASAKDNARALYAETLAPIFDMIEERVNACLVPMLGMDPVRHYAEFDLSAKLAASFEEQASVLQSAVGGPWMTRNEARARMNLPAIEGGDELIVPLNVTEGGLASANDTDPTVERYNARPQGPSKTPPESPTSAQGGENGGGGVVAHNGGSEAKDGNSAVRFQSKASVAAVRDLEMVLRAFYERQATSMANSLAGIAWDEIVLSGTGSDIFRGKPRWVRELAEDLTRACELPATDAARQSLLALGADPDALDAKSLGEIVGSLCRFRADDVVQSTFTRLLGDLGELWDQGEEEWTPENVRGCVQDSYRHLMESRVERNAGSMATAVANAGTVEGARQSGVTAEKEWVTGPNARASHAAMNGKRVAIDKRFMVGTHMARWPGDTSLPAHESCNCNCRIDIVARDTNVTREHRIQERIESAEVVHDNLYDGTPAEVTERVEAIGREERSQWENGFRKSDRSAASYRRTYGAYVESLSPEGRIRVEDFTRLEAKELQLAQWLANAGHTVEFRNADAHNAKDGKTTDAFLDGELWEFKRSETKNVKKMAGLITERLERQGPRFVLDLSISKTDRDRAIEKVASLLDDQRISEILVVRDGKAVLYKK